MAKPKVIAQSGAVPMRALAFGAQDGDASPVSAAAPLPIAAPPLAYETVAASASDQALGATGAAGDVLEGLLVVPASTSPGAVSIKDGAGGAITVFAGGASSVGSLVPFYIPLGLLSASGAWKVTTGANVSVLATGTFT